MKHPRFKIIGRFDGYVGVGPGKLTKFRWFVFVVQASGAKKVWFSGTDFWKIRQSINAGDWRHALEIYT